MKFFLLKGKMTKYNIIFIASLVVLVFTAGCIPPKGKPAKPPTHEPTVIEPSSAEPPKTEPNQIILAPVEPNIPQSSGLEPIKAEPNQIKPSGAEPNEVEPPKVEPNEIKATPKVTFHSKCASILEEFVNKKGMVDYKTLRRKRLQLRNLLDEFKNLNPDEYKNWPKEDKIAFWINAYNLQMLNIIVENYPIESSTILRILWGPNSIRHIDKSIGGIWKRKFIVMGEEFTLAEIERRFFTEEFDEPRVFFAISLASLSSPALQREPYYGDKLYEQLDNQAKKFFTSQRAFRIDRGDKIVYLSALLKPTWHGAAFINKYGTDKKFKDQQSAIGAVLNFITNYLRRNDVTFLELENYTVEFLNYDWTINDGSEPVNY